MCTTHVETQRINNAQIAKVNQWPVWGTADKFFRNVVDSEDYGEYRMPFLILRRLECLLADTNDDAVALAESGQFSGELMNMAVKTWFRLGFYNTSRCYLEAIDRTKDHVKESLLDYLDWFSEHITDIWEAFNFRPMIAFLQRNNRLWLVLRHFAALGQHPDPPPDVAMGDIMYRAFTTKGKGAGAFCTPRDAIRLKVDVLFPSEEECLR